MTPTVMSTTPRLYSITCNTSKTVRYTTCHDEVMKYYKINKTNILRTITPTTFHTPTTTLYSIRIIMNPTKAQRILYFDKESGPYV